MLLIYVNIRKEVKKISFYESNIPEGLAEKFDKVNNLEEETKNKL